MSRPTAAVRVARSGEVSRVVHLQATRPVKVLAPRTVGPGAWAVLSSFGGGYVGEDSVALEVEVEPAAVAFVTSQAASRVYRGARARLQVEARVGPGGCLVWWPDPTSCHAGAELEQHVHVTLEGGASLVAVELLSAGRVGMGERWALRRVSSRLSVERDGRPVVRDALVLDRDHGALEARLEGVGLLGTALVLGPLVDAPGVLEAVRSTAPGMAPLVVASPLAGGVLVRVTAPGVEAGVRALRALLEQRVSQVLGESPFARKY